MDSLKNGWDATKKLTVESFFFQEMVGTMGFMIFGAFLGDQKPFEIGILYALMYTIFKRTFANSRATFNPALVMADIMDSKIEVGAGILTMIVQGFGAAIFWGWGKLSENFFRKIFFRNFFPNSPSHRLPNRRPSSHPSRQQCHRNQRPLRRRIQLLQRPSLRNDRRLHHGLALARHPLQSQVRPMERILLRLRPRLDVLHFHVSFGYSG